MNEHVPDTWLKRSLIIGAICGALFSMSIALSMDIFFADTLQGTWRDAAAKDVTKIFGESCGQNWFAVTLMLVVVLGFLAAFGAVLGVIGGFFLNRFFKIVLK